MSRWNHDYCENGGYLGLPVEAMFDPDWDSCVLAIPGMPAAGQSPVDLTGRHTFTTAFTSSTGAGKYYPASIRHPAGQTANTTVFTTAGNSGDFTFPGDWGMGGWVQFNNSPTGNTYFAANAVQMTLTVNQSFAATKTGGGDNASVANLGYVGAFHHFWIGHMGQVTKLFFDGWLCQSFTDMNNYTEIWGGQFGISSNVSDADFYISDWRVYKGIPKYFDAFIPPQRALAESARRYPPGIHKVG